MRILERSSLEAYVFAFAALAASAFPMTWYLRTILVLFMAGIIVDLIIRSPWTASWPWRPKLFCCLVGVGLLGAAAWRPILEEYHGAELPDVSLRLVHPESPAVVLDNTSHVVAREIKWFAAIWNADDLRTYIPGSSGDDPLPIPTQVFDAIRPNSSSGNESLFLASKNAGYIKAGNRLIGSLGVVCASCARGYTYFVYIVLGKGGWYAESQQDTGGQVRVPRRITKENLEQYFSEIEQIPVSQRHEILERE